MPPVVGDRLIKESSRRYVAEAMQYVRNALSRESRRDVETKVGQILTDVMVRSEELEAALARSQAEAALSGSQLKTVRDGLRGIISDNSVRVSQWNNEIQYRSGAGREDFLWKTWDWLAQSVKWAADKIA